MQLKLIRSISQIAAEESSLLSWTTWSFIVRLAGMVASFIYGIILARNLNPAGFGTYGIVVAIAMVLSVVGQFGLQTVGTREISVAFAQKRWGELRGQVSSFFAVVVGLSLVLTALWMMVALLFPSLLGQRSANIVGALLVPVFALTVLASAELRAVDRIVTGQMLEILIRPVLMCALVLSVIVLGWKLSATFALGLLLIAGAIALAIGLIWLRSAIPPSARRAAKIIPRGWVPAAAALAAVDLLKQLDATYGILLLGALSSEAEAGFFRVALSTVIFVATPLSIFNVVLAPSLARLHCDGERHRMQWILSVSAVAMFAVTIIALVLIAIVGRPLITIIFGAAYESSWMPLLLLTCAQAINGFFGVGWVLLSMSGGERKLTASYLVSVCVSIVLAVPLTIIAGARGAAATAVVGALIQNLLVWRGVRLHSSLESSAAGFLWRNRASVREPD